MVLEVNSVDTLADCLDVMEKTFSEMPDFETTIDIQAMRPILLETALKMRDNYPYAHPLYAGQMLKPPHPIARLAYMMALWVNPNNHALDGGRASSQMEKEVVVDIARMFGWPNDHLGHLTSGGTMANLEALWIAEQIHPGKTIVASSQAHYTHSRITQVLKIPYQSVAIDELGRMSMEDLEKQLKTGSIGTVVVTLGTTGIGAVDPLDEIIKLQEKYDFRIHIDSAYGGYFRLAENLAKPATDAFALTQAADSIVVDPHKCGLQPYGCGCILFKDPSVGRYYQHDSPYTYFSSDELHLGEISLECSRAGAGAVALWTTMKMLPLNKKGQFATEIMSTHLAAMSLYNKIANDADELSIIEPQTNIVVWAPLKSKASELSKLSQQLFDTAAEHNLHLATIQLPSSWLAKYWPNVDFDEETVTCMRSCLMKAEHIDWVDDIWNIYKSLPR